MKAKIIGQNHTVTTYLFNGRKRHIVEDIPLTTNRRIVNDAVSVVGRAWSEVYNFIDERCMFKMPKSLERTIDSMTY